MEGILKVTPEQLEATAGEFANKGTTVGNLTSEMTQLVEGLNSIWEGEPLGLTPAPRTRIQSGRKSPMVSDVTMRSLVVLYM